MSKAKLIRKAGEALGLGGRLRAAVTGDAAKKIGALDLAQTFGLDILFGGLAAAQTPGDLGDKLIAGTTQAVGGGLGGVGLTAAIGPKRLGNWRMLTDVVGSIGGDMAGMAVGDNVMRLKDKLGGGQGQTPYERMSTAQQQQFADDLTQQILNQYGIIPGTREQYAIDPSTGMGVA